MTNCRVSSFWWNRYPTSLISTILPSLPGCTNANGGRMQGMTKHTEEFSHLTFSQREGLIPIPGPLELGNLPGDLRYELWKVFEDIFVKEYDQGLCIIPNFENEIREILCSLLKQPYRYLSSFDGYDLYEICEKGFV